MMLFAYKRPTKLHALQVSNVLQPPLPKKAAKLSEMDVFGGCHAENKENSVVPAQNLQSNSQQFSVMHSNVMHFTNSYGSFPLFGFNFGLLLHLVSVHIWLSQTITYT